MNTTIFNYLYSFSHQSHFFDNVIIFIAEPFAYIVLIIAVAFLLFHHDVFKNKNVWQSFVLKWKEIFMIFFSVISAWVFSKILKTLIYTPRPFLFFSDVKPLFLHGGMDSFPSGHATLFSALAVAIYVVHKKVGYVFMFFALIIGLSRIVAGVHFPVDILAGFAIGTAISFTINKYFYKISRP